MAIPKKYTDLSIDQTKLDMELSKNTFILKFWLKQITVLSTERDKTKKEIKEREAELRLSIVSNPEKYKYERINKETIDAITISDSELSNLESDLISINYDLGIAYSYRDLFRDRKEAIHGLIKLYLNNYYADGEHPELECYTQRSDDRNRAQQVSESLDKTLKKRRKSR